MPRKVRRDSTQNLKKRFTKTTGCDVDKDIVVIANYSNEIDQIHTKEFEQTYESALKAVQYSKDFGSDIVILESTANYHLLFHDVFKENNLNVKIINPLLVSALLRVEGKNDKADAITLSRLAMSFDLKTSNMPDPIQRHIRLFLRTLDQQVRRRTQLTNRLQSTLTAYGCNIFRATKVNSVSGLGIAQGICEKLKPDEILEKYWKGSKSSYPKLLENFGRIELIPEYVLLIVNEIVDEIHLANSSIEARKEQCQNLIEEIGLSEIVSLIMTAPAMTPLLALRILGEMGIDFVDRYPSNEKFVKAIGVCPQNIVSGGKVLKKQSSHGNTHLKQHLLNSVKSWCVASKQPHPLRGFYMNYKNRSNFKKAISAVSRKLMVSIYAMVKYNQPYQAYNNKIGENYNYE